MSKLVMPKAWTPVTRIPMVIPGTNIVIGNLNTMRKPRVQSNDTGATATASVAEGTEQNRFGESISWIGFIAGAFYAHKQGSGVWGFVGYMLLFSAIGGVAGTVVDLTMKKK